MLFLNIARCLFGICVPIFIVLSGYLLAKREFNKNHICKLGRIVIVYILCSIVCLLVLHFIENRDVLRLKDYIFQILSFEAAPYSWYVNMYFGLFNYYRSYNALFELGSYSDYGSLEVWVVTILFVNLILNFKFKISNKKAIYFISKISYLTFGAYLVSVIFDRWFYPILKENTSILLERVCYLLLVVPLIFICSLLLSLVIEVIAYLVNKLFRGTLTFIGRKRRHEISFEE